LLIIKDSFFIRFNRKVYSKTGSPNDFGELQKLAKETKTKIIEQCKFEPSLYFLQADKNSKGNTIEMANYFLNE